MRKSKTAALFTALVFLLSACGSAGREDSMTASPQDTASAVQESGTGGCYVLSAMDAPENTIAAVSCQGKLYYITMDQFGACRLIHDGAFLYEASGLLYAAAGAEDGIWFLEAGYSEGESGFIFNLISLAGEVLRSFALDPQYEVDYSSCPLLCSSGKLYLKCRETLLVMEDDGSFLCEIALPEESAYPVKGGDGNIYIASETESGCQLFLLDASAASLSPVFSCAQGRIFSGDSHAFLLFSREDGLFSLAAEGDTSPIVIWSECSLAVGRLLDIFALDDGGYFCMLETGPNALMPAIPSEVNTKTELSLAAIGQGQALQKAVADFNSKNRQYYINIVDYSQGGAYDADKAITRLKTEILSGTCPDMVCFSGISPYPFLSRGLLLDLGQLLEQDEEISLEDIAISRALNIQGGIYYIGSRFQFETLVGRYSDFGDRYGWTFEEYLDRESALPADVETIHNMTKDAFLNCVAPRYIRTGIDWNKGTCSFDSPEFIEILEASSRIRETPEDANNMSYGYGAAMVGEGSRVAALSLVDSVWKLAYEEQIAGCKLSFIGWPTVNGSCGSDVHLNDPIGIMAQGENVSGCWEFIKFMLTDSETGVGIPVYLPLLEDALADAKTNPDHPVVLSDADADRFLSLVASLENVAIYDETVLDIIEEESAALFSGVRTASETAARIQSRVSIYVSEQS